MAWESESIPDSNRLFMRAHKSMVRGGQIGPSLFVDRGDSLSTNWEKYCQAPELCQAMAKVPKDNGVLVAQVDRIRNVKLTVEHTPVQKCDERPEGDRSHTCVKGEKTAAVRLELVDLFEWALPVPA